MLSRTQSFASLKITVHSSVENSTLFCTITSNSYVAFLIFTHLCKHCNDRAENAQMWKWQISFGLIISNMVERQYEILYLHFNLIILTNKCRLKMALFSCQWLFSLYRTALCSAMSFFCLKIKCLIPLDVTVKGHWERLTLPDTLHHIWIFYYLQQREQNNSKTPLNILLHIGRGVVFYFKKYYSRMTKLAGVQIAIFNYNSQALDCDQMYSKVLDWVSKRNIRSPKSGKPQFSYKAKQQASSTCISKI